MSWNVALKEVDHRRGKEVVAVASHHVLRHTVIISSLPPSPPEMSSRGRSLRHGCRSRFECQARRIRYPIDSCPHFVHLRADLGRERCEIA